MVCCNKRLNSEPFTNYKLVLNIMMQPIFFFLQCLLHARKFSYSFICSYAFQVPEGWNLNGHYRSICYMRPLGIWAMQWALTQPKLPEPEMKVEVGEASLLKEHVGYTRVSRLLKLPVEKDSRSLFQVVFDFTRKRVLS